MQNLDVTSLNPLGRTRSWPIVQVASGSRRTHASSLRSSASASAFQLPGTTGSLIAEVVQFAGTRAQLTRAQLVPNVGTAQPVAGIPLQFIGEPAQVAVFGAGAPNTTGTKASDQLFRSTSGEDLSPPIYQAANEMTETKGQAGPKGRRS